MSTCIVYGFAQFCINVNLLLAWYFVIHVNTYSWWMLQSLDVDVRISFHAMAGTHNNTNSTPHSRYYSNPLNTVILGLQNTWCSVSGNTGANVRSVLKYTRDIVLTCRWKGIRLQSWGLVRNFTKVKPEEFTRPLSYVAKQWHTLRAGAKGGGGGRRMGGGDDTLVR